MRKVLSFLFEYPKSVSLVLGVMSSLAFAPFYALYALLFCLTLEWVMLDQKQDFKSCLRMGYWYGFGFFAAGFYWVGNALLIDVEAFGWLYPIALFGAGAFFGLFLLPSFALWCYFDRLYQKILSFAAMWVLMEWVRSFLFTGFPWNLLGTIWAFDPIFIQTASIWGAYGLSFLTILIVGGFYASFKGYVKSGAFVFVGTLLFMFLFGLWRVHTSQDYASDITVRLVQPSIPQQMKWDQTVLEDNLKQYIELSLDPSEQKIDFVVWGETAVPFDLALNDHYRKIVAHAVPEGGYLITGALRYDGRFMYNSLYVVNDQAQIVDFYDKNHLVPFGEYIPLRQYLPNRIKPIAANIADFGIGEKYKNIKLENYPDFGALICYEIIFPDEVLDRKNKPQWLVLLSNDGWYGDSAGPYQHLVAAQMRAVEEGITIVRSANSGISAVVSPIGKIMNKINLHHKGYLDVKLPIELKKTTAYSFIGKSFIVWGMILILLFIFASRFVCLKHLSSK